MYITDFLNDQGKEELQSRQRSIHSRSNNGDIRSQGNANGRTAGGSRASSASTTKHVAGSKTQMTNQVAFHKPPMTQIVRAKRTTPVAWKQLDLSKVNDN